MFKVITVNLNKIRVSSYSAIDNSVMLEIDFNDGADKQIFRNTNLELPEKISDLIFSEIKKMEHNINQEFDGKDVAGDVNIMIKNDEQDKNEIKKFFLDLNALSHHIKTSKQAEGYMDMVREMQKKELSLK